MLKNRALFNRVGVWRLSVRKRFAHWFIYLIAMLAPLAAVAGDFEWLKDPLAAELDNREQLKPHCEPRSDIRIGCENCYEASDDSGTCCVMAHTI